MKATSNEMIFIKKIVKIKKQVNVAVHVCQPSHLSVCLAWMGYCLCNNTAPDKLSAGKGWIKFIWLEPDPYLQFPLPV